MYGQMGPYVKAFIIIIIKTKNEQKISFAIAIL